MFRVKLLLTICLLFARASAASTEGEIECSFSVVISTKATTEVEAQLDAEIVANNALEPREAIRGLTTIPGKAKLKLPCATWNITVEAKDYWSTQKSVDESHRGELSFEIFPAGYLEAKLEPPSGYKVPKSAAISFYPTPNVESMRRAEHPRGASQCEIVDVRVSCLLPAVLLDYRIELPPYAPIYSWASQISHRKVTDLGTRKLVPGASVVGWVIDSNEDPVAEVGVALKQAIDSHLDGIPFEQLERLQERHFATTTSERGFFQLAGVPEGIYRISAEKEGFGKSRYHEDIAMVPTVELELSDRIIMAPPGTLQLRVDPKNDHMGLPWEVSLSAPLGQGYIGSFFEEKAPGVFEAAGLEEGNYGVTLFASDRSKWHEERVDIRMGQERVVDIKLPLIAIEGTVTRGDEAVEGQISFNQNVHAQNITMSIDEEGMFFGLLPSAGSYGVRWLPSDQPKTEVWVKTVDIEPGPFDIATVDIELPDTNLEGDVIFENGDPAPGATVTLLQDSRAADLSQGGSPLILNSGHMMSTNVEEDGSFKISGFAAGDIEVFARLSAEGDYIAYTTSPVRLNVMDSVEQPVLELVLRKSVIRGGMVWSDRGPLAGAVLHLWPDEVVNPESMYIKSAVTEPDGSFTFEMPESTRFVSVLLSAPGVGTRLLREPIEEGKLLMLEIDGASGTLNMNYEFAEKEGDFVGHYGILHKGGIFWASFIHRTLAVDQRPDRGVASFANFGAGEYGLCKYFLARELLRQGRDPSQHCVMGYLSPSGELDLVMLQN